MRCFGFEHVSKNDSQCFSMGLFLIKTQEITMNQHSVMDKHSQIISGLSLELDKIDDSSDKILEQLELAIVHCKNALEKMRELVFQEGFPDQKSEIYFFKKLKPEVYSKLLYYMEVFDIQSKLPNYGQQLLVQYYQKRMNKILDLIQEYHAEVQYFQCGFCHFDKNYFTRDNSEIPIPKRNEYYLTDEIFHTWHDHTFSEIIASQMLIDYVQKEIYKLEGLETDRKLYIKSKSKWTGKKIFLIELAYGIHHTDMVNDGNSEIKDIIEGFEQMFDIDLKEYSRSFIEIKRRKIDRTKFLNLMKSKLEDRMNESDL